MENSVNTFIQDAENGKNVYIHNVRRAFAALERSCSRKFTLILTSSEEKPYRFDFTIPRFCSGSLHVQAEKESAQAFIRDYCMAELYNIVSCLGARSMRFYDEENSAEVSFIYKSFIEAFGIEAERPKRSGYGRSINVAERILDALDGKRNSKIAVSLSAAPPPIDGTAETHAEPQNRTSSVGIKLKKAVQQSDKGVLLGIDVGGTDIKLALSVDGKLTALKEYDWFPATFTRIHQLIDPILALADLMRYRASADFDDVTEAAMPVQASDEAIGECLKKAREYAAERGLSVPLYDAIGLSFPDVVVKDSIVGGEVFKTRGIRENPAIDYEEEFRHITTLNKKLAAFVKKDGVVGIVNDGPMAAFSAAAENAYANTDSVNGGVLAYTLGTELGTGYLDGEGKIPDIPLEVYNFIIDLGSWPEKEFASDDVRSINNFNTELPGTLQKYTSQSGAFRLAVKYFLHTDKKLYKELFSAGFLHEKKNAAHGTGLYIPAQPKDMRKPFLEYLMALPQQNRNAQAKRIFTEIGEYLAIAFAETKRILQPHTNSAVLFGRLVKQEACFKLLCEGGKQSFDEISFAAADNEIAATPLMCRLKADKQYTIAQFAQAIGAVHYASYRKNMCR